MNAIEELKKADYNYIVQIHNILDDEWLDYAQFKELGAAVSFVNYQLIKDVVEHGEPTDILAMWRVTEK